VTAPSLARTGTRDPQHASAKSNAGWAGQGPLWELEVPGPIGLPVVARRPATASGALTVLDVLYCAHLPLVPRGNLCAKYLCYIHVLVVEPPPGPFLGTCP
jgi:hypothetical protein